VGSAEEADIYIYVCMDVELGPNLFPLKDERVRMKEGKGRREIGNWLSAIGSQVICSRPSCVSPLVGRLDRVGLIGAR
jgi:hypothetical protein